MTETEAETHSRAKVRLWNLVTLVGSFLRADAVDSARGCIRDYLKDETDDTRPPVMPDAAAKWLDWRRVCGRADNTVAVQGYMMDQFIKLYDLKFKRPSEVSMQAMFNFCNDGTKVRAGTRKARLSMLRSFFEYAHANGWCVNDLAKAIKINYRRLQFEQKQPKSRRPFTEKEIERLLIAAKNDAWWTFAVMIGSETGLRLSDIAQLEWSCVKRNHINEVVALEVWTAKRDKVVQIAATRRIRQALAIPVKFQGHKFLFPSIRDIARDPSKRAILSNQFGTLCANTHITGKSFHSLRTYYIQRCKKAGISVEHIAELVGHSSTKTTEGYLNA